jgi:3-oxoacyl-[acyl-carrier protein] reductase
LSVPVKLRLPLYFYKQLIKNNTMQHLENKIALVTGGSRGMGAAIARRLAEAGATVVITYLHAPGDGRFRAIQADSGSYSAVTDAVGLVVKEFGRIDILVNNAGVYMHKHIAEHTADDYEHVMNVNTRAVFAASVAAVPHMPAGGRIIHIGSNMAERVAAPGGALYAMSKSALIGLTKGMARDLGPQGITVNLVQPGPTDTDMNPANGAHADGIRAGVPLGRYGIAEEVAGLVAFLVGPDGGFTNGAMITADGGFHV